MSNEIDPERRPGTSNESLLVLLLGGTLFAAGAAMLSYAIVASFTTSAKIISQPAERSR